MIVQTSDEQIVAYEGLLKMAHKAKSNSNPWWRAKNTNLIKSKPQDIQWSTAVFLNLFAPADRQTRQNHFMDQQHTIAMNGPDYHNNFANQSHSFILRILIFRK